MVRFFKKVGFVCVFSAALRWLAFILALKLNQPVDILFCFYLDLWLADVNAVIVLSAFLFSWISIPFSRHKICFKTMSSAALFIFSGGYLAYCSANQLIHIDTFGLINYTLIPGFLSMIILMFISVITGAFKHKFS